MNSHRVFSPTGGFGASRQLRSNRRGPDPEPDPEPEPAPLDLNTRYLWLVYSLFVLSESPAAYRFSFLEGSAKPECSDSESESEFVGVCSVLFCGFYNPGLVSALYLLKY